MEAIQERAPTVASTDAQTQSWRSCQGAAGGGDIQTDAGGPWRMERSDG